jgi:hypothetical protein
MTISRWRHLVLPLGVLALSGAAGRPLLAQANPTPLRLDTAAVLASARPEIEAANAAWFPGLQRRDAASIAAV